MMLTLMAIPRVSWMLLSCLMLLSQVQGQISLPLSLPSLSVQYEEKEEGYHGSNFVMLRGILTQVNTLQYFPNSAFL
jgi:hypothetical protein